MGTPTQCRSRSWHDHDARGRRRGPRGIPKPMRQSAARSLGSSFDRSPQVRLDPQSIADAYVYLLGRMLVIRQEHIDLDQVGADYNVITYDPLGNADLVDPNFDVASL